MNEYKPNSNRFKEEQKEKAQEKRVEKPVVTGTAVVKKRSALSKFADEFISEDAKNVKSYVLGEVLIPSIKKAICDIVIDSINMILYGGTRGDRRRSTADRVSYSSFSKMDTRPARSSYSAYSFDDVELDSRGEAQEVLDRMDELVESYGLVRVADFYDLVGITGSYTDNKYGWTNLRSAEIVRTRNGKYVIKLPRAMQID